MQTQSTNASGAVTGAAAQSAPSTKMGKDEFVKLLLAQLGNQDPLSPMDSQAFVAQLAQFANVELLQSTNQSLESLLVAQASTNQIAASNLVGKDARYITDHVTLENGETPVLTARLSGPAANVTAVLTDASGRQVRTMAFGAKPAGTIELTWDGRDDRGNPVPPGTYQVHITAADINGTKVPVQQETIGHIDGVSFTNGYAELILGSSHLKLSDVLEVLQSK